MAKRRYRASNTKLSEVFASSEEELDLLLAERQRRASEAGDAVAAAKIALERLRLGFEGGNTTTYSEVFDLLSRASEQQIAAALRKTEPSSDGQHGLASTVLTGRDVMP